MVTRILTLLCAAQLCFSQTHVTPMAFVPPTTTVVSDSQGPNSPTNGDKLSSCGGDFDFSNPTNIYADDANYASFSNQPAGGTSSPLLANGFGFTIPENATIDGIKVEIKWQDISPSDPCNISGCGMMLVVGDEVGTAMYAATSPSTGTLPTTEQYYTFGSSTSMWGTTLTYSDINSTYFGVRVGVTSMDGFDNGAASVNHIRITVYYH